MIGEDVGAPVLKKKIKYEDRPIIAEKPLEVDGMSTEPEADRTDLPEKVSLPPRIHPEEKTPFRMDPDLKRSLLVGATPLLMGILTGNTVEGAQVAGDNLINEDKLARERQTKDAKKDFETQLARARLERELARQNTEKEKQKTKTAGGLEDKHVTEVMVDGKPVILTNDQAIGKEAWKAERDGANFHLDEKKELEKFKAGLKLEEGEKPLDKYQTAKSENDLYRLYQKDSDTTKRMADAYTRFKGTVSMPSSSANDLATIFNYMKILDPGSVVREGEQASAANAVSVPESVRNMYNRLLLGKDQLLPAGQRERFFREASAMYKQQLNSQATIDNHFRSISKRRGLDANNIVRGFTPVHNIPDAKPERTVRGFSKPAPTPQGTKFKNKEGKEVIIDKSKLTPRMKKDLAKDGFKES